MDIKVNDLTQGLYESILDELPSGAMTNARFQGALVGAAVKVGWVETPLDLNLRVNVVKVYAAIQKTWNEATVIPNA